MTETTPLSPAAYAVVAAAHRHGFTNRKMLAAAFRAAALPLREAYANESYLGHPDDFLIDLAAELEAPTLLERAMKGDANAAKQFLHEAGFTDKQGQWLPQYQPIDNELESSNLPLT